MEIYLIYLNKQNLESPMFSFPLYPRELRKNQSEFPNVFFVSLPSGILVYIFLKPPLLTFSKITSYEQLTPLLYIVYNLILILSFYIINSSQCTFAFSTHLFNSQSFLVHYFFFLYPIFIPLNLSFLFILTGPTLISIF